jgi:hypothetical protein
LGDVDPAMQDISNVFGADPMSTAKMQIGDIERNAKLVGLRLAEGHGQAIVSLLTEIRCNVSKKASTLKQDAPLAVYFDAR